MKTALLVGRTSMRRFMIFCCIGGGVFGVGLLILFWLNQFNVDIVLANTIQLVVTFIVNLELNRRLTWRDRYFDRWTALRFFVSRLVTAGLSWVAFIPLHNYVNYLVANVILVAAATIFNFVIGDRLVFRVQKNESRITVHTRLKRRPVAVAAWSIISLVLVGAIVSAQVAMIAMTAFAVMSLVTASLEYGWRTYSRRTPEAQAAVRFPTPDRPLDNQAKQITLIIPAYHEAGVIAKTLGILATQSYDAFEVLVSLRSDDLDTIAAAREAEAKCPELIKVFVNEFTGENDNKSTQLNAVLKHATGEYTAPIDAEDIVANQLLIHVNQLAHESGADVIQCGVQLTNLDLSHADELWWGKLKRYILSGWFAVHNVMEYYFWFSSRMFFQIESGFVPLGGNTVFIRTEILREIGGWNVKRLAEDCAIGTYISVHYDAKFVAAYSANLATQEHTPPQIFGGGGLFRQRVRWDQGFWQVLNDREWLKLPTVRQRLMAFYILAMPLIQAVNGVVLPISIVVAIIVKAPVSLVMVLFTPFVPLGLTMIIQLIALREFSKEFGITPKLRHFISLVIGFFPYQVLLGMAAVAGVVREMRGIYSWSKTDRSLTHHQQINVPLKASRSNEAAA